MRSTLFALAVLALFFLAAQPSPRLVGPGGEGRTLIEYSVYPTQQGDAMVEYAYARERLPARITPDEDVSKRTVSSYTRYLGTVNEGGDARDVYELVSFTEPVYAKIGDAWYVRESATTTLAELNAALRGNPVAALFVKRAYADSISPFSGAGDGYTDHTETGDAESPVIFADCDGNFGVNGAFGFPTATVGIFGSLLSGPLSNRTCEISRAFLPFDTSSISSSATISAATLNIYVVSKTNGVNDGTDTGVLIQTTQASSATLADTDHTHADAVPGATSLDITSMTTSAYNTWTLDATGISWIKKSGQASNCGTTAGYTCLGLREGHDLAGSMTQNINGDFVTFSTSEQTGTTQDPYLSVTYSVPASPVRTIYLLGNVYLRGVWLY